MSKNQTLSNNMRQTKRHKNIKDNVQKLLIAAAAGATIIASGDTDEVDTASSNIIIIGITTNNSYSLSDFQDVAGTGVDISADIDLATITNNTQQNVKLGATLDGGTAGATLYIFGVTNLSGITLLNIDKIYLDSEVVVSNASIAASGVSELFGTGTIKAESGLLDLDGIKVASSIDIQDSDGNIIEPVAAASSLGATISVEENSTAIGTFEVTDESAVGTVSYELSGVDAALFEIDANGVLTFKTAADFENPQDDGADNVYDVTITATDEHLKSTSQNVAITVTDVVAAADLLPPILQVSNQMTVAGVEFRANTVTTNYQDYPSITGLADGGFVVVWQSNNQDDAGGYGIYGQKYNADGSVTGAEFLVNSTTAGDQVLPNVTSLKDGSFVITWFGEATNNFYQIYGQIYNVDGTESGNEFQINSDDNEDREFPSIVGLKDGGFVVVWQSYDQDGDDYGIYGQKYNTDGSTNGAEFLVNSYTSDEQTNPAIAALDDGGFIIVWESYDQDGDDYGIYGQKFNADGSTNDAEFLVNATTADTQSNVAITTLNDGSYVITWQSYGQDGSDYGIYAKIYKADHTVEKSEFLINTYVTDWQNSPSIAALSDGGFVVVWESYDQDGDDYGIYGQRFDAVGVAIDDEFHVNSYTINDQDEASVTAIENGGFVVSWSSKEQDGSDRGIYAQRYEYSDIYKFGTDTTTDFDIVNLLQSEQDSSTVTFGSVSISDVPSHVSFSQGSDDGNGTWTFAQGDLDGLQITTSNGEMGNFSLTLSVTLTHSTGTSTTNIAIDVSVGNVITGTDDGSNTADSLNDSSGVDHVNGNDGFDTLGILYLDTVSVSYAIKGNDLQLSYGDNVDLIHSIEKLAYMAGGDIFVDELYTDLGMTEAAYDIWLANSYDFDF